MARGMFVRAICVAATLLGVNFLAVPAANAGPDTGKVLKYTEQLFQGQNANWDRAKAVNQRALEAEQRGDCETAEPLFREAFELRKSVTGDGPFEILGEAIDPLVGLSACLHKRGEVEEALQTREREWDLRGWTNGLQGEKTLAALDWIKEKGEEAIEAAPTQAIYALLGRAYANLYLVHRQDFSAIPEPARKSVVKKAIEAYDNSQTRLGGGDVDHAIAVLEAALLQRWDLGEDAMLDLEGRHRLVEAFGKRSRAADAEYIATGLVIDAETQLGRAHPKTIHYLLTHAGLIDAIGYPDEALAMAEDAHTRAQALPADDKIRALARFNALDLADKNEPSGESLQNLLDAYAELTQLWGRTARVSTDAGSNLVFRLVDHGQFSQAKTVADQVYAAARDADWHIYETEAYQVPVAYAALHLPSQHSDIANLVDGARIVARDTYSLRDGGSGVAESQRRLRQFGRWGLDAVQFNWATLPPDYREFMLSQVFMHAQDALKGGAASAIAEDAAIRWARRISPGAGRAAELRKQLVDRWNAMDRSVVARIAGDRSASGGDLDFGKLSAARNEIRSEIREIDDAFAMNDLYLDDIRKPTWKQLSQIQPMLARDEAMVLLVPTKFQTHSFLVTRVATHWHQSGLNEDQLGKRVRGLLMDVGATIEMEPEEFAEWEARNGGHNAFDRKTAHELYRELIAPHEPLLDGKTHLFFGASGALSSLPLSILVAEPPQGEDDDPQSLRDTAWLADRIATVQIPSVNAWAYLRQEKQHRTQAPRRSFAGFGDPLLDGSATTRGSAMERRRSGGMALGVKQVFGLRRSASGQLVRASDLRSLARLPGTALELEAMRAALDATPDSVVLRAAATETAVKQADLAGTRVLAFATHGLVAGELAGVAEPGLVLTPPSSATPLDDGLLTASEIARLELDADWVILSACNTAAGNGSEGAIGLSGLASAFFYAGADNLLASHWPVRDDVAARLTVRTIEISRDDPSISKAGAFRQAMTEIRNDHSADSATDSWAHPTAWAPFTLIGDR